MTVQRAFVAVCDNCRRLGPITSFRDQMSDELDALAWTVVANHLTFCGHPACRTAARSAR